MSEPLVHKPSGFYRPPALLAGHRGIADDVDPFYGSLKHAWMMNDIGTQTDEVSTKHLNARNSPTRVTGKINYAQQYTQGSAKCHYHSVAPAWGANNWDWALSLWIRSDATPTTIDWYFFNVENNTGNTLSVRHYVSENKIIGYLSPDSGSTQYICTAHGIGAVSVGTWYHVILQYIKDTSLTLWVNNTLQQSQFADGGYANGRVVTGARVWNGTGSGNCSVDAIHFWDNYELTSEERAYMYNSGSGRELF